MPAGSTGILPPHYGYGEIFKKQANRRTSLFQKTGQAYFKKQDKPISKNRTNPLSIIEHMCYNERKQFWRVG